MRWSTTAGPTLIRRKSGLPPATYFSGGKLKWLLDNVDGLRADAERGEAIFGTIDTWLIWHLTGGIDGGAHVTDVTNAGRTMLMDLETLDWDDELLGIFDIPRQMLPEIRPSSDPASYGEISGAQRDRGGAADRRPRRPARGHGRPGVPGPW